MWINHSHISWETRAAVSAEDSTLVQWCSTLLIHRESDHRKKKNDAGMFVKTLLNTPVIWENDLSWNITGRGVWLMQPRFYSSNWFLGSARLQYMSPSILVQSVLYLCHPLLKDNAISHLLNFWTGSHMNSCTTSQGASEGICHGCDWEL